MNHKLIDNKIRKGEHRSIATEFKKGSIPFNKGTKGLMKPNFTSYKKGDVPVSTLPIGTIILRCDGYLYKKIKNTKPGRFGWKQVHRINWEKVNGPIPEGHKIMFLDGNRENCKVSNLTMITDGKLATMNKLRLCTEDPELTKTGLIIANIVSKAYSRNKEVHHANNIK